MESRIKRKERTIKLPVIGNIKIGDKNTNGCPMSLDYFRATGDYAKEFHDSYGDRPTVIKVAFLSDNDFESCHERMEIYKGSKLYASGDGENFTLYSEKDKGFVTKVIPEDKLNDFLAFVEAKVQDNPKYKIVWQHVLTLRFMILGVSGIMGVWQFSTRAGKSTIKNIIGTYDKVKELGGTVTRTLFDLKVQKVVSNKYGNKNKFPVVSLIPNMTAESLNKIKNLDTTSQLPLLLDDSILSSLE